MMKFLKILSVAILSMSTLMYTAVSSATETSVPDRIYGKVDAPVTVDEYVSLTCSHCADFYNNILPQLENAYIETGKVKFILHDFPLDGIALKAALISRCMPAEEYYPFVKMLYKNQMSWAFTGGDPEKNLTQYAKLGGLSDEKAKSCLQDSKLQDAVIAERTTATNKFNVEATPTFLINGGAEVVKGSQTAQTFAAIFDRLLAEKK